MNLKNYLVMELTKIVLNLAINYGGRHEITQGVQEIAQKVMNGEIAPEEIT